MQPKIAVIGVGTQGSMISFRNAIYNKKVAAFSRSAASREKCRARIDRFLAFYVQEGRLTQEEADRARANITYAETLEEACQDAYMIVENIPEVLERKQELFGRLHQICGKDVLFSSNTSSLLMSEICKDLPPERKALTFQVDHDDPVRNSHVEMMWNGYTSEETKQAALAHYRSLGFEPVVTEQEIKGYSINRVWRAVKKECLKLWAAGYISPSEFDRGWMTEWHTDIGPFKLMDLIGLDTILNIEYSYFHASGDESDRPPARFEEMVKSGRLGMKTGSGFYEGYDTEGGNLTVGKLKK